MFQALLGNIRVPSSVRRRRVSALSAATAAAALLGLGLSSPAGAPAPAAPAAAAQRTGWSTVFSDDFDGAAGSGVDPSDWRYDTGPGFGFGTGEIETMTDSTRNVHLDGRGDLDITALDDGGGGHWTSGRIQTTSADIGAPAGGELEVTASIEQPVGGLGYWPAFWMLGPGQWPENGELDIMEDVNSLSEHSGTVHCGTDPAGPCDETDGIGSGLRACSGCQAGYHTYTIIVNRTHASAESVTWYLDGTEFFAVNESQVPTAVWRAAIDHGFSIILDLAMGGSFPDGACGCTAPTSATASGGTMSVQYVTAYRSFGAAPPPSPSSSPSPLSPSSPSSPPSAGPSPTPNDTSTSCTTAATADISADCYKASQGTITASASGDESEPAGVDGDRLSRLSNGDWVEYPGIDFGSGSTQFDARVASGAADGVSGLVQVGIGSPTNIVGSFAVANTGGWNSWKTVAANISKVAGTQNVYLVFSSGASGDPPFAGLHYFDFPDT